MSLRSLRTPADSRAGSLPAKWLAGIRALPPISPKVESFSLDHQELTGFRDKPCPRGYISHKVLEAWAGLLLVCVNCSCSYLFMTGRSLEGAEIKQHGLDYLEWKYRTRPEVGSLVQPVLPDWVGVAELILSPSFCFSPSCFFPYEAVRQLGL